MGELRLEGMLPDDYLNLLLSDGEWAGQIVRPIRVITAIELKAALRGWLEAQEPPPAPDVLPPICGQRDPHYRDLPYTQQSGQTFGTAGCYVCALTALVAWAGYAVDPIEVARALDERGAFVGAELLHPELLADAYPALGAYQRIDWHGPADLAALQEMLDVSPVVVQIDFHATRALEPHFMLAFGYHPDPAGGRNDMLMAMDPWDAAYIDAAADVETGAGGKRNSGGYFWPEWWAQPDMDGTQKTRVQRLLWGARYFEVREHA